MINYRIDFRDFAFEGNRLLASGRDFNGLMNLNLENGQVVYESAFEGEEDKERHGVVIKANENIYFVPAMGRRLDIYEIQNKILKSIEIYPDSETWHCMSAYLVGNKLILLPFQWDEIVCYDTESGEVKRIDQWEEKRGHRFPAEGRFFSDCGTVRGHKLFAVSQQNAGVMELDVEDLSIAWRHFPGDKQMAFSNMSDDGKYLWLAANKEKAFVRWDMGEDEAKIFRDFPGGFQFPEENGIPFCNMLDCGDKILAVAIRSDMSIWIDKKNGSITECLQLRQDEVSHGIPGDTEEYRLAKKIDENTILLVSCRDKAVVKLNLNVMSTERVSFGISRNIQQKILLKKDSEAAIDGRSFIVREEVVSLSEFLEFLERRTDGEANETGEKQRGLRYAGIGNKIFTSIKERLI